MLTRSFFLFLLALSCLVTALAKPGSDLNNGKDVSDDDVIDEPVLEKDYRLPVDLTVLDYRVNLTFPKEAFSSNGQEFFGISTIIFQFKDKVNTVKVHASKQHLTITKIKLANVDFTSRHEWDNDTNLISITTARAQLANTNITLVIHYTGKLSTNGLGVYKSSYVNAKGETKYYIYTHLKPTHAREVFPSFDEPHLKAQFYFNITAPTGMNVLFNAPLKESQAIKDSDYSWFAFHRTPVMSTYLTAFVISEEFDCTTGADLDKLATSEVCTRADTKDTRKFALEQGPKVVEVLEEITGIKYSANAQKLSQVAVPDDTAGAMENWGLIIYMEKTLLYDDDYRTNAQKQFTERVIAHEIAHQWFGNLVTCKWWSELFLNKGFARYYEWFVPHKIFPDWGLDNQFVTTILHDSLTYDAESDADALQSDVTTPDQIARKFSDLSYNKGASILRMVSHVMGPANFQKGIKAYVDNRKNSYAEPTDLWTALQENIDPTESNIPDQVTFVDIMENWTKQPGYPLISVSLTDGKVKIKQERFLSSGENKALKWYVPIAYTTSSSKNKFSTANPTLWLKPDDVEQTIDLASDDSWIILNNQQSGDFQPGIILGWYLPTHFRDRGLNQSRGNCDVTDQLICFWYLPFITAVWTWFNCGIWKKEMAKKYQVVVNYEGVGMLIDVDDIETASLLLDAYYRVNYDEALWSKIGSALNKADFDGIHELNRAQIVNDVFNLFKIGKLSFEQVVNITEFLKNDVSLSSWTPAISMIIYINKKLPQDDLRIKFQADMLNIITKLYNSVPLNSTDSSKHLYSVTQALTATWACYLGNQDCVSNAKEIFKRFKDTGTKLGKEHKNIKTIVYCNAIRYSTDTSDWDAVWNAYVKETLVNERNTLITALGCTNDVSMQKKYLQTVISSDTQIKSSEAQSIFSSVYTGSSNGVGTALNFLLDNFEAINRKFGVSAASSIMKGLSEWLNTNTQVNRVNKFVESMESELPDDFKQAVKTAVKKANANIEWMKNYGEDIYTYYKVDQKDDDDSSFGVTHKSTVCVTFLSMFVLYFR